MAIPVQWRRGNSAQTAAFTGAVGEITVNTTTKRLHLHDGVTAGGIPVARLDETFDLTSAQTIGGQKTFTLRPVIGTATPGTNDAGGASTAFVAAAVIAGQAVPITIRQAIQYGPTTGNFGAAALIPVSQVGNTLAAGITLKHSVAATLYSVANGFNADGSPLDLNWLTGADLTVPNLTASTTNYIWADVVAKTAGFVVVADGDQNGGTIPLTLNKFTFDYGVNGYKMYLGTGATATQSNRIIVAEVDTSATVVTAIRCRAYLAKAEGETSALALSTAYSFNHNLGTKKIERDAYYEFINTDSGYAVGDQINVTFGDANGSTTFGGPFWSNSNTCGISIGAGSGTTLLNITNKTTLGVSQTNAGNCKFGWSVWRKY